MFRQLSILLVSVAFCSLAAPTSYPTEEQSKAELTAAGMTQGSIDGLEELTKRFTSGFPLVQSNKEATDKFIAEYTAELHQIHA